MSKTWMLTLILIAFVSGSMGWSSHAAASRSSTGVAGDADGRLGGSRASFDLAYADQQPEVTGSGTLFSFDDLGLFLVTFQARTLHSEPDDLAAVIVISAPRDAGTAAQSPDPNDWAVNEALATAERFLPTDATVTPSHATDADEPTELVCQSDLLHATDFGSGVGKTSCQVTFIQPTSGTVSFVTLSLTDPATPSVRHDPCAEISPWADATGTNMTDAEALIASIDDLDLTAADAPAELGDIADDIEAIADLQRELVTPPPAAHAQTSLIEALDGYASALDQAADAISTKDDALLEQAITAVTTARNDYATADDRVLLALRACSVASRTT